jgi:hypothetical protein
MGEDTAGRLPATGTAGIVAPVATAPAAMMRPVLIAVLPFGPAVFCSAAGLTTASDAAIKVATAITCRCDIGHLVRERPNVKLGRRKPLVKGFLGVGSV